MPDHTTDGGRPSSPMLFSIVVAPRRTMRWILDHDPRKGVIALILAAFVSSAIKSSTLPRGRSGGWMPGPGLMIVIACIGFIISAAMAVGLFFCLAWIASVAGRMLGGHAPVVNIRSALAWGTAPLIWALVYRLPAFLFWRRAWATGTRDLVRAGAHGVTVDLGKLPYAPLRQILILAFLDLLVLVGYLVVASRVLAEAQGFSSSWRGLGNLVLTLALPVGIIGAIAIAAVWTGR